MCIILYDKFEVINVLYILYVAICYVLYASGVKPQSKQTCTYIVSMLATCISGLSFPSDDHLYHAVISGHAPC